MIRPEPRWVSPQRSSSPLPTLAGGEWALPSSRTLPRSQSSAMIFGSSVSPPPTILGSPLRSLLTRDKSAGRRQRSRMEWVNVGAGVISVSRRWSRLPDRPSDETRPDIARLPPPQPTYHTGGATARRISCSTSSTTGAVDTGIREGPPSQKKITRLSKRMGDTVTTDYYP